jgi:hypothetical protein
MGGAGALFGFAKSRLSAGDFSKVAAAVSGMSGLLKAAPSTSSSTAGLSGLSGLASSLPGGTNGLFSVAASFQRLASRPTWSGSSCLCLRNLCKPGVERALPLCWGAR